MPPKLSGPKRWSVSEEAEKKAKEGTATGWKGHIARYWIWYGIFGVVFLAIFLPLLFIEVIPAIAQLIVDKTDIPIYNGIIKVVSNDTLRVSLSTSLTIPSIFTVKLSPVILSVYNRATANSKTFFTVPVPEQTVSGQTNISLTDVTVHVKNQPELEKWLTSAIHQNTTALSVRGSTNAYLGILKNHIKLEKTVEIPALKQLEGATLSDVTVLLPPAADGANLVGHIVLPNWSELTLSLGNNTLNIWAEDILVANADVVDVHLLPGNNTLPFRGRLHPETIIANLPQLVTDQAAALLDGKISLWASGNTTMVDGQHITYIENVLRGAHIGAEVPALQLLAQVADSVVKGNLTVHGLGDLLGDALNGGKSGNESNLLTDFLDDFTSNLTEDGDNLFRRFNLTWAQTVALENTVKSIAAKRLGPEGEPVVMGHEGHRNGGGVVEGAGHGGGNTTRS